MKKIRESSVGGTDVGRIIKRLGNELQDNGEGPTTVQ